jgi:putative peptidoglycan lipid II flippase
MALLVLPVAAGMMALAGHGVRAVTFGETGSAGAALIAAALVALAVGLYPYGAFLLLARGFYALGDSRTPAIAALATSAVGVVVMLVGALLTHGEARVAMLGLGHTTAFVVGALWLALGLSARLGSPIAPMVIVRVVAVAAVAGVVAWAIADAVAGEGASRSVELVACVLGGAAGAAIVLGGYRLTHVQSALTRRVVPT